MEVTSVNEDQVSCPGSEIVFIDAKTGRSGTQVDQLDLLVPVGQEADIGIGTFVTIQYNEKDKICLYPNRKLRAFFLRLLYNWYIMKRFFGKLLSKTLKNKWR